MKVAILDKNKEQLDQLSNELCEHYFTIDHIFFYKFTLRDELMEFLFNGYQYRFIFLDEDSADLILIKTIEELLPNCPVIIMTADKKHIHLNNHMLLYKPYSIAQIFDVLNFHVYNTLVRPTKIPVNDRNIIIHIPVDKIYYLDSYYGKVYIHTVDGCYIGRNKNFYSYEIMLEKFGFLSIHKSIMINIEKVKSASIDEYMLLNDIKLKPSARRKHKALKSYIEQRNESSHYYRDLPY